MKHSFTPGCIVAPTKNDPGYKVAYAIDDDGFIFKRVATLAEAEKLSQYVKANGVAFAGYTSEYD